MTVIPDPAHTNALLYNSQTGVYSLAPVTLVGAGGSGVAEAPIDGFTYGRDSAAWVKVVNLAGDTMTGTLILSGDPATNLAAATKHYVDLQISILNSSRVVTASGAVGISPDDRVVAINKTAGSATTVNLPLASAKNGPVLISDFKRDAGTNNITINPTSPDLIQGLASLTLAANGASVQLFPIPGLGYAL
jgi:hypothetical protein